MFNKLLTYVSVAATISYAANILVNTRYVSAAELPLAAGVIAVGVFFVFTKVTKISSTAKWLVVFATLIAILPKVFLQIFPSLGVLAWLSIVTTFFLVLSSAILQFFQSKGVGRFTRTIILITGVCSFLLFIASSFITLNEISQWRWY